MTNLRGQRALVTGASGFIGTHLARRLADMGAELVCLDLKPPREELPGALYVRDDVRRLSALSLPKIDRIYNLAAVHTTPGHPDHEYYDTNVWGALEAVKLAERDNVQHITFTSSISIYGPSEERKVETSDPAPVSAYGKSKLMAEEIHRGWLRQAGGRKLTIVRPAFASAEHDGAKDSTYELLNGAYPECPTLETIVTSLRDSYFPSAKLYDVPQGVVMGAAKTLATFKGFGLGIHPDRVTKLVRSTYVYPGWATENGLLGDQAFRKGLERWARATNQSFV